MVRAMFTSRGLEATFLDILCNMRQGVSQFTQTFYPSITPLYFGLLCIHEVLGRGSTRLHYKHNYMGQPFMSIYHGMQRLTKVICIDVNRGGTICVN